MSVSAIQGVGELVKLCAAHGVERVVVSPGSRNAPLSMTFDGIAGIETYVIPDERSAGFFALGLSLATQKPVAVLCTSGSAAFNYAPAVSEAYYQKIPLVVITADRPQAWINQGDGQTIMQDNIYGRHVLFSAALPLVQDDETAWQLNRQVNEALLKANGPVKGPVHLNIPFREPLYRLKAADEVVPRVVRQYNTAGTENVPVEVRSLLGSGQKVLFLAGQINHLEQAGKIAALFGEAENAVVLSETTSNLRGKGIYTTIDRLIDGMNANEKQAMAPDVLVTFGDALVSKKAKAWLRQSKPKAHVHIGFEHNLLDTYQCLSHWLEMDSTAVLRQLLAQTRFNAAYAGSWHQRNMLMQERHNTFMQTAPWSDLQVFDIILQHLSNTVIHLGNSSPVRYAQLFDMVEGAVYFSNRGTSGIDGSSSTAAGYARASNKTNVLLTGDISFYYDSNALWNQYLGDNLKIVLINNGGGNIFRIIDGPGNEELTQRYFEAKQETRAEDICRQFGIHYFTAASAQELQARFPGFMQSNGRPALIEVFTGNLESPQTLKTYFNFLKS